MILRWQHSQKGQATTEVVLLFPLFVFFLFAFAKIYALLILVQKLEVASYYGARRWQLESHRNVDYEGSDSGALRSDIERRVSEYLGFGSGSEKFLDLVRVTGSGAEFNCTRTQVWNICTLRVQTRSLNIPGFYRSQGNELKVTKYVPNRDRPIDFILPGVQDKADKAKKGNSGSGEGGQPVSGGESGSSSESGSTN